MRADRLLSILLLLQTHGKMSAGKLADELEVSERTVYRDIDALNAAGVPIYGDPGPGGGYTLLDNYHTHLTGLTDKEIRALFMLSIPEPLMELGVGKELKTALLKLSASLPGEYIETEKYIRQRFHLDSTWWQQSNESVPQLRTVHEAILQDRKLLIKFRLPFPAEMEQLVVPLGLVAKAGVWYLVYSVHDSLRTTRVDSLLDAHLSEDTFNRLADFDLATYWDKWCSEQEIQFSSYNVLLSVTPDFFPVLQRYFSSIDIIEKQPEDAEKRVTVKLSFASFEAARDRILGFGRSVEVVEPQALHRSVLDYAEQIVNLYKE